MWLGSKWRIGDGNRVRIRGDKWLPDSQASWVVSPQKNLPNNTKVCALIDEERGRWLEDRVREEFLPHGAEAIISLPQVTWAPRTNSSSLPLTMAVNLPNMRITFSQWRQ